MIPLVVAAAFLLASPSSEQGVSIVQKREVHLEDQQYRVDVSYPEITGAGTFNAAVRRIVDPLLDTLKNAHDCTGYLKGNFTALILKNGTVSVLVEWEGYCQGAAHPGLGMASVNYDTRRGRVLYLADLFRPGVDYLQKLSTLAVAMLGRQADAFPDREWIRKGASPLESNFKVFTLTDKSLVLHFQVYQVAAGAAGPQEVDLSLDELRPLLRK